jgi:hypothetical protein
MTHAGTPGHGDAGPRPYFPESEWEVFHDADRHAAAYVVGLMAGIFAIGLILYFIVFVWVWSAWA